VFDPNAVVDWFRWDTNPVAAGIWHRGKTLNIVNGLAGGAANLDLYADTAYALLAEVNATKTGTTGGRLALRTRTDGGALVDTIVLDALHNVTIPKGISGTTLTVGDSTNAITNSIIGLLNLATGQNFQSNSGEIATLGPTNLNLGTGTSGVIGLWTNSNKRLTVDTNGNLIGRGVSFCLRATAIETRSSTITLTNSTQLTYAIPAAGTYAFEIVVFSYFTTAVTDGITANVNYSGTFTAVGSYLYGDLMNGTTTTLGIQPVEISATVNNALTGLTMATYGASVTSAAPACHFIKGNLIATGTGTLAFAFAQSTSGVDTTNLGVGSWMTVTQLS
jgi:hypothetical protein